METKTTEGKAQGARTYSLTLEDINKLASEPVTLLHFINVGKQFEFLTAKQVMKEAIKRAAETKK